MTSPKNSALPPGPKRHWLLGTGIQQLKNPLGLLVRGQQKHGDIVFFHQHHGPTWLLSHPDHAQRVLADNATNYLSMMGDGPDPMLGRGLFASKGDFWLRQRRMVQPAFHRPRLARMVDGMVQDAQRAVERLAPLASTGEPVELLNQMRRLVISMLGTSIFSKDIYESQPLLRETINYFSQEIHSPHDSLLEALGGMLRLYRSRFKRFMKAVEDINTVFYGLIAERRQSSTPREDVLTMLIEARDTQGVAMTDTEVRDELVSLYVGGHESTSVALTWICYEVANHPEVQQRIREELATVLGGNPLTAESLQALHYTRAVVEETLRLRPPAWQFVRRAAKEDQLGSWTITPDTKVIISPYILHRHRDFWEEPERFIPERFLPERKEGRHRYAYLPFGAGQRQCVGNGYTLTLLTTALATLLQHYQLRLAPGYELVIMSGSTHRPRNGVLATIHPVPAAA
ncbi:cytochrome P450 [Archangium lansingense]|uniref:cytochrome P450 n=1 Tax=Archangium lansingense TaxID=2995310 RepID=UPI003B79E5B4